MPDTRLGMQNEPYMCQAWDANFRCDCGFTCRYDSKW